MSFNPRRRVFLMRHGSVTYFDSAGKPVLPELVPLNEQGREQAAAAGRTYAAAGIRFDRVIVSGLPRTVETARRVLAETAPRMARLDLPGRPAGLDPAEYAPIAED